MGAAKRLAIEIEVSRSGRGFEQTTHDVEELEGSVRRLRKQVGDALEQDANEGRRAMQRFENQIEQTAEEVEQLDMIQRRWRREEERQRRGEEMAREWRETRREVERTIQARKELNQEEREGQQESKQSLDLIERRRKQWDEFNVRSRKWQQEARYEWRQLRGEIDRAGDEVDEYNTEMRLFGRSTEQIEAQNRALSKTRRTINRLRDFAIGSIIADMFLDAIYGVRQFAQESRQAFFDFDRSMREVFTLAPELSAQARENLARDAKITAEEIGRLPAEVLPALYQALSLGIPKENALDAVKLSSQAARAGVSELDDTLTLGVSILNSYKDETLDLNRIYDVLFWTIKNGAVTLRDLNQGMNRITSVAAESGVSLEDVAAALVVMTRQGDSFNEAADLLSNMLTQLQADGSIVGQVFSEVAGQSFPEFIAQGGNLADAMEILDQHAQDTNDSVLNLAGGAGKFYRDILAGRGAMELTGRHLQDLRQYTDEANVSMGNMAEAAAVMGESAEMESLRAKAALEDLKIAWGQWLAEISGGTVRGATQFFQLWSGMKASTVEQTAESLMRTAAATGDWTAALIKLRNVYRETTGFSGLLVGGDTNDVIREQTETVVRMLALQSGSYEEFEQHIKQFGKGYVTTNMTVGQEINRFRFDVKALWEEMHDPSSKAAIEYQINNLNNLGKTLTINADRYDYYSQRATNAAAANETVAESTNTLNEALLAAFTSPTVPIDALLEAQEAYTEASGQWVTTATDHSAEIEKINTQLARDITDEQRSELWDKVIKETDEGSQEWLEAWNTLQTDLTNTQRAELVKQRADLLAAQGDIASYYTGNINEAEAAQEAITAAHTAIIESFREIAIEAALAKYGPEEFVLDLAVATGVYTQEEADLRYNIAQRETAMQDLIESTAITTENTDILAGAIDLLAEGYTTSAENAIWLAQKADELGISLDELVGEYVATILADTDDANRDIKEMEAAIDQAVRDRTMSVKIDYSFSYSREGTPDDQPIPSHTGGHVSPTQPYLVGDTAQGQLTPYSELFVPAAGGYLYNAQQTRAMLGQNQQQPVTIYNIYNQSREAAALTQAIIAEKRRQQLDAYMGV